jgi:peptidoglycan/xylan/chitin deacetylase (PgdA/CDA1 family)
MGEGAGRPDEHQVSETRTRCDRLRRSLLRVLPQRFMDFIARHPPVGEAWQRVETREPVVALTYDDGPNPPYTLELLDVLDRYGVKAAFFMVGRRVEAHPDVARAVLARGHEVGNHSYSHAPLILRAPSFVCRQIAATDALLRGIGARGEILFRSPYGAHFFAVPYVLWRQRRKNILFDVIVGDWEMQDPQRIAARVLERTTAGSIIVLHDGGGARPGTVAATALIVEGLRERGYRFVGIGELLAHAR